MGTRLNGHKASLEEVTEWKACNYPSKETPYCYRFEHGDVCFDKKQPEYGEEPDYIGSDIDITDWKNYDKNRHTFNDGANAIHITDFRNYDRDFRKLRQA